MGESIPIIGPLLGKKPKPIAVAPRAEKATANSSVDPNLGDSLAKARERALIASKRKGRSAFRTDLPTPQNTGTGISIPSRRGA